MTSNDIEKNKTYPKKINTNICLFWCTYLFSDWHAQMWLRQS